MKLHKSRKHYENNITKQMQISEFVHILRKTILKLLSASLYWAECLDSFDKYNKSLTDNGNVHLEMLVCDLPKCKDISKFYSLIMGTIILNAKKKYFPDMNTQYSKILTLKLCDMLVNSFSTAKPNFVH